MNNTLRRLDAIERELGVGDVVVTKAYIVRSTAPGQKFSVVMIYGR